MFSPTRLALVLAAGTSVLAISTATFAADYSATSRIDAVTVFPSEASITRAGTATVEAGEHVIRLTGLPLRLDRESVRVTATAPFAVELGAVDLKPSVPAPIPVAERSDVERKIAALTAEVDVARDKIHVGEIQLKLLDRLGNAAGDGLTKGIAEGKVEAQAIADMLAVSARGSDAAFADIRNAKARQRDLEIQIANLKKSIEQAPKPDAPSLEASIALVARGAGEVNFRLEYRVPGAGWQPVYEARLTTGSAGEKPSIDFATRAAVTQQTGEAWENVALTLSTTRPSRGTAAPELMALLGELYERVSAEGVTMPAAAPPPAPSRPQVSKEGRLLGFMSPSGGEYAKAASVPVEARELQASAEANGTTVVYRIPGRATIQSGPDTRTLKVTSESAEPVLTLRVAPKLAQAAFITASFAKAGDAALLPGRVALYRDGTYVGQGRLPFVANGDQVRLGFGEDERIKVSLTPIKQVDGETGTFTSYRTSRTDTKISIRNLGQVATSLLVEDQVPVSKNDDLKFEALSSNTPGSKPDADGRRGVLTWAFDLKPGDTKDIRIGWQARWPANKQINWVNDPK